MSYLYAAFGIVWIVLIAYLLNLIRLQKTLINEMKLLKRIK